MNTSALTRAALTAFARANRSRFEGLLRDFVECPTVSVDPTRKSAIADGVKLATETIRAFGGSASVHESGGNPLVSGRWGDDASLRPAVEDLWGAGAVVAAYVAARPATRVSPEAEAAHTASEAVRGDSVAQLRGCASGIELVEKGFGADVAIAAELDASSVVPVLTDGWFRRASSP